MGNTFLWALRAGSAGSQRQNCSSSLGSKKMWLRGIPPRALARGASYLAAPCCVLWLALTSGFRTELSCQCCGCSHDGQSASWHAPSASRALRWPTAGHGCRCCAKVTPTSAGLFGIRANNTADGYLNMCNNRAGTTGGTLDGLEWNSAFQQAVQAHQ
jgi:hypothetical protein